MKYRVLLFSLLLPLLAQATPAQVIEGFLRILNKNSPRWAHSASLPERYLPGLSRRLGQGSVELSPLRSAANTYEIHGAINIGNVEQNTAIATTFATHMRGLVEDSAVPGLRVLSHNHIRGGGYRITLQMPADGVDVQRMSNLMDRLAREVENINHYARTRRPRAGRPSATSVAARSNAMVSTNEVVGELRAAARAMRHPQLFSERLMSSPNMRTIIQKLRSFSPAERAQAVERLATMGNAQEVESTVNRIIREASATCRR